MTDSSAVPANSMDPVINSVASIHLIDEEKKFSGQLDKYLDKCYRGDPDLDSGLNYHIVSVFGSQSTGKSTLLNRLFGTQFDVMDEEKRQQTTKGIWFSHGNFIASAKSESGKESNAKNIYVLDVEGVDGRERADDKDFERKSALFALATSEILIVNIFEHQVGLYQGANMELLKTVMEVNLSLFHNQSEKCMLLFVVRDFTGLTPLSNLAQSLESDMKKIWSDLTKPKECSDSSLEDFFDLKFFAIGHKHYQPENFEMNIKQLGDEFLDDSSLFNDNKYHKKIPIDAWSLYAEKVWDQIENNRDLDLPTQQILVSKFKCNDISTNIYEESFLAGYSALSAPAETPIESCAAFKELRDACLSSYDSQASRYKESVYKDIRKDLMFKIDSKLKDFHTTILSDLTTFILSSLEIALPKLKKNTKVSFQELLTSLVESKKEEFKDKAKEYIIIDDSEDENSIYSDNYAVEFQNLTQKLMDFSNTLKIKESNNLVNKITKKFQLKFKDCIVEELASPTTESWDLILQKFEKITQKLLKPYLTLDGSYDFHIGLTTASNEKVHMKIMKGFWNKFESVSHDYINEDSASRILRTVFEDTFKFDSKGLPLVWKSFDQVDSQFNLSKQESLKLFPFISKMLLSNGQCIKKQIYKIEDDEDDDEDVLTDIYSESEFEDEVKDHVEEGGVNKNTRFSTLLSAKQQTKVKLRFKKESDAIYLDAKRSLVANRTSIPTFMYVLLILLGWNEFMAVLRNPFLFILAILLVTGLYFAYNMQMLGPILTVANAMINQTKVVVKEKLRDVLLDDGDKTPTTSRSKETDSQESYELQDL